MNASALNVSPLTVVPDGTKPVQLGSGTVTRILGTGGMSNVYEIWNSELEIHKAVKLMHPTSGKDSIERFHTEIKICAKLNHPNIVEIHSVGRWNNLPFIEMERVEGTTLESLIKDRGPLPAAVVVAAGILACNGLSYAHSHQYQLYGVNYHGIVHRDLKPANVMICMDGQLKLMDFGIARPLDASFHTMDGNVVGTLQYLSPEQLDGGTLDVRTDIYALGETLYEALSGYQAFPHQNVPVLMSNKLKNRFKPLTEYHTNAPAQLIRLIHKAMARDRESRVPSAAVFAASLKSLAVKMGIDEPQHVIRNYMISKGKKQPNLQLRKKFPAKTVLLSALFIIATGSTALLLLINKVKKTVTAPVSLIKPENVQPNTETPQIQLTQDIKKNDTVVVINSPVKKINPEKKIPVKSVTTKIPEKSAVPPLTKPEKIVKQHSILQKIQLETGIYDTQTLFSALYAQKRYKDILAIFDVIPVEQTREVKNAVLALRSQILLGNNSALGKFLSKHNIEDSEFYLAKAKIAWSRGESSAVSNLITAAKSAPRALLSYEELGVEISYYEALLATGRFDENPSESTYKEALDKWRTLRAALGSNNKHQYFQKEREERKRMSQIYASIKDQQ